MGARVAPNGLMPTDPKLADDVVAWQSDADHGLQRITPAVRNGPAHR